MLNRIWFWLLLIGIAYGFGKGMVREFTESPPPDEVAAAASDESMTSAEQVEPSKPPLQAAGQNLTEAVLNAATVSVEICLGLIGVMALWLGMLQIAKDAGLVDALARALRPLMRWLFPDVPDGHPAQGAMLMNMSANMLGLDNAATPFGLQAMRELQTLNPTKETATNAMAMFLAINTSSVTLVPISIIAIRVAAGSENPASPIAGMLMATIISTIVAITAVKLLAKSRRFSMPEPEPETDALQEATV